MFQAAGTSGCIYLGLRLLHFQVWRVGEQVSGQLNGKPACLIAVAMSVEGLSTRKQHLHTQHQVSKKSRAIISVS